MAPRVPNNQIKNELLEPNTPKWRLFRKQLPASNFWPNERVHVSASEPVYWDSRQGAAREQCWECEGTFPLLQPQNFTVSRVSLL